MSAPAYGPSEHVPWLPDRLHPDALRDDPALALVRQPHSVRVVAMAMALLLPLLAVALLVTPWQQSALGRGSVIAFAPEDREQVIEAPIGGVVAVWHVSEGQSVVRGQPLVELRDNDPALPERLAAQATQIDLQLASLDHQTRSYEAKLQAERAGVELVVAELAQDVEALRRKRVGEATSAETEAAQLRRLETLAKEGIASVRDADLARGRADNAHATLAARDREIAAAQVAIDKARAQGEAKVAEVEAELEAARAKRAEAESKRLELWTRQARQATQAVVAPRDGVVLRLHDALGGGQVKPGDQLLTLVPDTSVRAVELFLDGNDMPLVEAGTPVRVVFEGWPALQFVGLPGTSVGTFGGRVAFVDATDDGQGRFRVVVRPDPADEPWPEPDRLRQGVQVKGFALLGRVPLGFELWRQLNGFPAQPAKIDKGEKGVLPSQKKPRAPAALE